MRARWWWAAAPVIVALLGTSFLIANTTVDPLRHERLGGTGIGPARVGDTRFFDISLDGHPPGAHITAVHLNGLSSHLNAKVVATTFFDIGEFSSGFLLKCAKGSTHPVNGTEISEPASGRSNEVVLRIELTPTAVGRRGFRSITIDWRRGIFHGSRTFPLALALRVTTHDPVSDRSC